MLPECRASLTGNPIIQQVVSCCFVLLCFSMLLDVVQYLLLGWAVSQRDLEVLIKLAGQLCGGAAAEGGATIVVLTQREKLEMEELFR